MNSRHTFHSKRLKELVIGDSTEEEAFYRGYKRGLLVESIALSDEWREKFKEHPEINEQNVYIEDGWGVNPSYIYYYREESESTLKRMETLDVSGEELGELLGYPERAYKNWQRITDYMNEYRVSVNYHGLRFMLIEEDLQEVLEELYETVYKKHIKGNLKYDRPEVQKKEVTLLPLINENRRVKSKLQNSEIYRLCI